MIILFRGKQDDDIDDNGIQIQKRLLAPPTNPPAYQQPALSHLVLPSLSWLCLTRLMVFYDQVDTLGFHLQYLPEKSDILEHKLPVDPRLWATIAQLYDNLPEEWQEYSLPLCDQYVPPLQRFPWSSRFALVTLLDLPGCVHLCDETVSAISALHALVALDGSSTSLTAYGIKALAASLQWVDDSSERRGLWQLRILRLRNCRKIDHNVFDHIHLFPLLSVLDLQGTQCRPTNRIPFHQSCDWDLFHPAPLNKAIDSLRLRHPETFPTANVAKLFIRSLNHPPPNTPKKTRTANTWTFNESKACPIASTVTLDFDSSNSEGFGLDPRNFYKMASESTWISSQRTGPISIYNTYHAKKHYAGMTSSGSVVSLSGNDPRLALYRSPPPHSYLDEYSNKLLEKKLPRGQKSSRGKGQDLSLGTANLDRSRQATIFGLGRARIEGLRNSELLEGRGIASAKTGPKQPSRNPFKRHSLDSSLLGSAQVPTMSRKVANELIPPSTSNDKAFKPISTITIPAFPTKLATDLRVMSKPLATPSIPTSLSQPKRGFRPTPVAKSRLVAEIGDTRKRPKLSNNPSDGKASPLRRDNPSREKSRSTPFDWHSWSCKPG